VELRDLTIQNEEWALLRRAVGMNGVTGNILYHNLTISGFFTGIEMPFWGTNTVHGGTFTNNFQDIVIFNAAIRNRYVLLTGPLNQPHIVMASYLGPIGNGNTVEKYFVQDAVIAQFGLLGYHRLYDTMHQASAIPFPEARSDVPAQYVGKTNQEIWNLYGKALGGQLAPINAFTVPYITGLIGAA
jgi:hypothetical protein